MQKAMNPGSKKHTSTQDLPSQLTHLAPTQSPLPVGKNKDLLICLTGWIEANSHKKHRNIRPVNLQGGGGMAMNASDNHGHRTWWDSPQSPAYARSKLSSHTPDKLHELEQLPCFICQGPSSAPAHLKLHELEQLPTEAQLLHLQNGLKIPTLYNCCEDWVGNVYKEPSPSAHHTINTYKGPHHNLCSSNIRHHPRLNLFFFWEEHSMIN